jgi:hypothetical protein
MSDVNIKFNTIRIRDKCSVFSKTTANGSINKLLVVIKSELLGGFFFGLCPSSSILETSKHDVSESGSDSVLR